VNPIGPRACYDEGKRAAETLFFDYHRSNTGQHPRCADLQHLRPAHAPLRRARGEQLHRQAINGEQISMFGDGSQSRSFCYRDDLVEGIIRMMNGPDDFPGPVNIGNPNEFTIRQLAELVVELTGSPIKEFAHKPLPEDDPKQRQPDITLAKAKLGGWEPKIQLREGLTRTIEWFKKQDLSAFRAPTPNY
jgi:UDP-glucuronate decarboxylase